MSDISILRLLIKKTQKLCLKKKKAMKIVFVKVILVCSSEAFLVCAYKQGEAITVVTKRAGTKSTAYPVWSVYYLRWCIN